MSGATEELRRLLAELGVEWFGPVRPNGYNLTRWHIGGVSWTASEIYGCNNILRIVANTITPEQAIAATRGHGTLTAEQVRHAVNKHHKLRMVRDADGLDIPQVALNYQAIASELNAALEL